MTPIKRNLTVSCLTIRRRYNKTLTDNYSCFKWFCLKCQLVNKRTTVENDYTSSFMRQLQNDQNDVISEPSSYIVILLLIISSYAVQRVARCRLRSSSWNQYQPPHILFLRKVLDPPLTNSAPLINSGTVHLRWSNSTGQCCPTL